MAFYVYLPGVMEKRVNPTPGKSPGGAGGQPPGGCGLAAASAAGKGKFNLRNSFPERDGEGSWCVSPIPRDKGVFSLGPLAGRMHWTHLEKIAPQ